jgi:hypothetical protein
MTSPESFVSRWARLKRSSDSPSGTEPVDVRPQSPAAATPANGATATLAELEVADAPFDPATLPSIESIGVDTDIRGFLQSRIPTELTRAALRQAWTSDPAIRDFIGIAENQWDFNDPEAISGFGPLPKGYDVSGLLSQVLGGRDRLTETIQEMPGAVEQSPSAVTDRKHSDPSFEVRRPVDGEFRSLPESPGRENAASENDQVAEANDRPRNQRRHGSALPRQDG